MDAVKQNDVITIPVVEYKELLKDSLLLACLQEGGVDNWDFYGDAVELFHERGLG